MEDSFVLEDVRKRLILAGLHELNDYGMHDFSLRRVALAAGVSCAAPYRHFKDKNELILSIIDYVKDGWNLLAEEIMISTGRGSPSSLIEMSIMLTRFWLGNGSIRSMLLVSSGDGAEIWRDKLKSFDEPLLLCIHSFSLLKGLTDEDKSVLTITLLSLIYGSLMVINSGVSDTEEVISNLKNKVTLEVINYV